jgi:F-type H+-transporting ATPase subunit c
MARITKFARSLLTLVVVGLASAPAFAQDAAHGSSGGGGLLPIGAALAIGLAALGGALGQGRAAASALEGISRNPQAAGKIFTPMIIALALTESLVLLAFLVANGLSGKI